jgi:hypothetical protein
MKPDDAMMMYGELSMCLYGLQEVCSNSFRGIAVIISHAIACIPAPNPNPSLSCDEVGGCLPCTADPRGGSSPGIDRRRWQDPAP